MILLLEYLVWTTLFAAGVGLFIKIRKPGATTVYLLWLVVLLKLLVPPLVLWPWSVADLSPSFAENVHQVTSQIANQPLIIPLAADEISNQTPDAVALSGIHEQATEELPVSNYWFWINCGAVSIWLLGSFVLLVRFVRETWELRRLTLLEHRTDPPLQRVVQSVSTQLGIKAPEIHHVPNLASPVVFWLGTSQLLWPTTTHGEFAALSQSELKTLVTHELAHIRRRDHWLGWLESFVQIVWWWFPTAQLVVRRMSHSCEECCDQWVRKLHPDSIDKYANFLLKLVERTSNPTPNFQLTHGMMTSSSPPIRRRLELLIQQPSSPSTWQVKALISFIALFMVPHLMVFGQFTQDDKIPSVAENSTVIIATEEEPSDSIVRHMEYLVGQGGRWTAENPMYFGNESQPRFFNYHFNWGPQRSYVKGEILGTYDSGNTETYSEVMIFWDPVEKTMQFHQYGSDGSISKGVTKVLSNGDERLEFKRTNRDGSISQHRYLNERTSHDEFVTHPEVQHSDGNWAVLPKTLWKRDRVETQPKM